MTKWGEENIRLAGSFYHDVPIVRRTWGSVELDYIKKLQVGCVHGTGFIREGKAPCADLSLFLQEFGSRHQFMNLPKALSGLVDEKVINPLGSERPQARLKTPLHRCSIQRHPLVKKGCQAI